VSVFLGYLLNRSISKSGGKINKRLPHIRIKFLQIGPVLKIHFKNRSLHIHHWITYSLILIVTFTTNTYILDTLFSKGLLVGGILQGLTFPDWKNIIVGKDNIKN
jgi:hypothetical protein